MHGSCRSWGWHRPMTPARREAHNQSPNLATPRQRGTAYAYVGNVIWVQWRTSLTDLFVRSYLWRSSESESNNNILQPESRPSRKALHSRELKCFWMQAPIFCSRNECTCKKYYSYEKWLQDLASPRRSINLRLHQSEDKHFPITTV